jgi:hypothetical protein
MNKMISKYLIPFSFLGIFVLAGCQKLKEDPKASLTPVTYYKTQADLEAGLAAIYYAYSLDGCFGFTNKMTTFFGSDDLTTDPGLNKGPLREYDELSGTAQNGGLDLYNAWNAIYQANNLLPVIPGVATTDLEKTQVAGQCYFLRAMGYYYLVRAFGPLPLFLAPTSPDVNLPRSPVATIYASIVSDLQAAKAMLPASWPAQFVGKASSLAAGSMLADVYLTMAGWPLNQTSNYALAAAEADTVINSNAFNLSTPYDKVFSTNNTPESIFALQYSVAGNVLQRTYGNSCVPLEETALNGNGGWDDYYPEINFYKRAPVCTRKDATFYTTIKLIQPDKSYKLVNWADPATHARHPYYKKFRSGLNGDGVTETDTSIISMSPSTSKALDIIRYPLVLLDYAEASTMAAGNPSALAYSRINLVRQRAGEAPLTAGLGATAFRDSVVFERGYEFAGEFGVRWFDIVRLQLLPQVIAGRDPSENPIPASVSGNPAALENAYIGGIPFNEMVLNPTWTQNPGY